MTKKYVVLLSLLLIGCSPIQNLPRGYYGPISYIEDTYEKIGTTKMYIYELKFVNGRNVYTTSECAYGQKWNMDMCFSSRQVPAEPSKLHLSALTSRIIPLLAISGGNYRIEGNVDVLLEPNKEYLVKGVLEESYQAVWLEEKMSGVRVSEAIENGVPTKEIVVKIKNEYEAKQKEYQRFLDVQATPISDKPLEIKGSCSSAETDSSSILDHANIAFNEKQYIEAAQCYYRLANEPYSIVEAMQKLGFMYELGKGLNADLSQAKYWYKKAGLIE